MAKPRVIIEITEDGTAVFKQEPGVIVEFRDYTADRDAFDEVALKEDGITWVGTTQDGYLRSEVET
jgi:hypothetical protein